MADYFEIFDDKRAGIMGALDRAVTEAHAWELLQHWNPDWEMVALPPIENRLANFDAYDPEIYNDCFDMIWTIARSDWLTFRESYMLENPPCRCRQLKGKRADYCWPRYPEGGECAMCEEIRDYYEIVEDNEHLARLVRLDNAITERGDWEYWATDELENWRHRTNSYGVYGVTEADMRIISGIAKQGFRSYIRSLDAERRAYQDDPRHGEEVD